MRFETKIEHFDALSKQLEFNEEQTVEIKEKNIPTSIFANKEIADKAFSAVQLRYSKENNSLHKNNEIEIKEKNIPTSIFVSKEVADKLFDSTNETMHSKDKSVYSLVKRRK